MRDLKKVLLRSTRTSSPSFLVALILLRLCHSVFADFVKFVVDELTR